MGVFNGSSVPQLPSLHASSLPRGHTSADGDNDPVGIALLDVSS